MTTIFVVCYLYSARILTCKPPGWQTLVKLHVAFYPKTACARLKCLQCLGSRTFQFTNWVLERIKFVTQSCAVNSKLLHTQYLVINHYVNCKYRINSWIKCWLCPRKSVQFFSKTKLRAAHKKNEKYRDAFNDAKILNPSLIGWLSSEDNPARRSTCNTIHFIPLFLRNSL